MEEEPLQPKSLAEQITPSVQRHAEEEEEKVLQAQQSPDQTSKATPQIESHIHSLRSGGRPIPKSVRAFFEPRFGYDFSQVRVHTDARAAESARAVNAQAYTIGHDIVFRAGQYAPGDSRGKALLTHELTHVVQQDTASYQTLQRRMKVESHNDSLPGAPPKRNWEEIRDYIRNLSSSFDVDATGAVQPLSATHCASTLRFTDRCLCDLHRSTNPVPWKIKIDDIGWPHTEEANRRVTVHSTRSPVQFGAWGGGAQAGQRILQSNARVLGHELCGHAWLMEWAIHPPFLHSVSSGRLMGRPSHDVTVTIENRVARDIYGPGADRRGTFSDPHHGESFARITVSEFPRNSSSVSALPADMQARLIRVRDAMVAEPLIRADVIGHADRTGGAAVNRRISRQRARRVRSHLVGSGISSSRFRAVRGRSNAECPSAPVDNPSCRKVEVFLFIFEAASETSPV